MGLCKNCDYWKFMYHEGMANREIGTCNFSDSIMHQYNWCDNYMIRENIEILNK